MKVLLAHNWYRRAAPSGENTVVEDEALLLRQAGVQVVALTPSSDELHLGVPRELAAAACGPVYSPTGVAAFDRLLRRHRPDVVHLHNVFPLISPWVVHRARAGGVPTVLTVHNFRLDCVNGLYFRDGRICTDCAGSATGLPALRHGCYRGSRLQSLPMVLGRAVHRQTWQLVDRFLALTEFHVQFLRRLGVPAGRVTVRPTTAPDPGPVTSPGRDVLFVGRLDESKGVGLLLDAWRGGRQPPRRRLRVIGDGPLLGAVRAAAAGLPGVDVVGPADQQAVYAAMRAAGVVAVPSRAFEGFPRVVAEAFAHGRPVLATDHGGLAAVVTDDVGWRIGGGAGRWRAAVEALTDDAIAARGAAARERYRVALTPLASLASLLRVYDDVVRRTR